MKRYLALILAALLLLSMAGCAKEDESITEEKNTEPVVIGTVHTLNATIDGKTALPITEKSSLTAEAVLSEGMVVDHWNVNGESQGEYNGQTLAFSAEADTIVEAVLRPEKKVTTINAEMRFVNEKREAVGDPFTEFVFENNYTNTATGAEVTDGTVSVEVKAVPPKGYEIDYWLINGVPYHTDKKVDSFVVENLDEATTYEAVVKEIPIVYYKVNCRFCTFSGRSSGSVAAGSTITVTGQGGHVGEFYVNGSYVGYGKSIGIKIKGDTSVEFHADIN